MSEYKLPSLRLRLVASLFLNNDHEKYENSRNATNVYIFKTEIACNSMVCFGVNKLVQLTPLPLDGATMTEIYFVPFYPEEDFVTALS